jgi:hypothetical protein
MTPEGEVHHALFLSEVRHRGNVEALCRFGLPIGTWSGGRTRWNRARFNLEKTHALDALAAGQIAGASAGKLKTLLITATGRGQHCRTNFTKKGFPSSYLMRQKFVRGFKTGKHLLPS